MFKASDVVIEISAADRDAILVLVETPLGPVEIMGNLRYEGRTLFVDRVHVYGPAPGVLGRIGLNIIGRRLLEEADVDEIVIEGSTRASGRMAGRTPRTIRVRRT